jgi:hypothetical protein
MSLEKNLNINSMSEKIERKIRLEACDPVGQVSEKFVEADYYTLGWENQRPPEEYPDIVIGGMPIKGEPMKKVRYILTIGDHKYWVKRSGQIIDQITQNEDEY